MATSARPPSSYRGKGLRLLSLDGGGVRGLSSLLVLKRIMEEVDPDNPPHPRDWFDMIGGTSTGGLIAIMLGRLNMSIDQCIDEYLNLMDGIFEKQRHRFSLGFAFSDKKLPLQPRYSSQGLERGVRRILEKQKVAEDAKMKEVSSVCKT